MGVPRSRLTRGSFQPRKAKRMSEWLAFTSNTSLVVAANTSALFLSFSQVNLAALIPFTIVRVHGLIGWRSDQSAAVEEPIGAFGMAIVKEPARAIGITAIPTPIDEAADDGWFMYQYLHSFIQGNTNSDDLRLFEFDSKSMRMLEDGDSIVAVVENSSNVGASFNVQARILALLH